MSFADSAALHCEIAVRTKKDCEKKDAASLINPMPHSASNAASRLFLTEKDWSNRSCSEVESVNDG